MIYGSPSVDASPALAAERLERVRGMLRGRPVLRLRDLCEALGVSEATARRDLGVLENRGEVRRVHGGAVSVGRTVEEPLFDDKTTRAVKEKRAIAAAALKFIEPNARIYLDGGSTVLELARLLRGRTDLTVVTNSLRAAMELAGEGPRLILLGGELRRLSQTLVGPLTKPLLDTLRLDWAFMGTIGLDPVEGLTTTDPAEAYTKEQVMGRAQRVALLCDSSKLDHPSFARSGRLSDLDVLIVDGPLSAPWKKALRKAGVQPVTV